MQIPSIAVISAWPAPNYVDPVTRGPVALIVISILLSLVTFLLIVRIYTRLWISKGFGADDVFILLAYIPTTGFAVVSFLAQLRFDWGRHVWDLPFELITPSLQLSLLSQLLFDLATTLTKLSMLSLIYRVVSVNAGPYRHVVTFVITLVSLDGLIFFILVAFQCNPMSAYWTLSVEPQNCFDQPKHLLAAGCINTLTDFLILILPVPYVRSLKLPRRQKITVASLFAGGIFVTLAGAARTTVTFFVFNDPNQDVTWNAIPVFIVSALELYTGIICASLPPVKPFFARYLPRVIGNPTHWISTNSAPASTVAIDATSRKALDKQSFQRITSRESAPAHDQAAAAAAAVCWYERCTLDVTTSIDTHTSAENTVHPTTLLLLD
ncbi:hypothetical protein BD289DRAFT_451330 [Coniella lustricola]|uniref:Rhodopsin domain-containing protein n=1 Tax=Coniella lustricola TaxID=2025994 RepID=A0A2T3AF51_9PEZI|nr:hypothetical protein BD289DRAFT_451330 [Coniella lustricola]